MMKAMMPSANVLDDRRGSGLPVASTKTATLWAMMRRIRYATPITGDGSLLPGIIRSRGKRESQEPSKAALTCSGFLPSLIKRASFMRAFNPGNPLANITPSLFR